MFENLNICFKNTVCEVSAGEDEQGTPKAISKNPQRYFAKAKNKRASGTTWINNGIQTLNALTLTKSCSFKIGSGTL